MDVTYFGLLGTVQLFTIFHVVYLFIKVLSKSGHNKIPDDVD